MLGSLQVVPLQARFSVIDVPTSPGAEICPVATSKKVPPPGLIFGKIHGFTQ